MKPLLKEGSPVTLLDHGQKLACTVNHAGVSGFTVTGFASMRLWGDRGKTWESAELDRIDATRNRFNKSATSGGR